MNYLLQLHQYHINSSIIYNSGTYINLNNEYINVHIIINKRKAITHHVNMNQPSSSFFQYMIKQIAKITPNKQKPIQT